MRYADIYLKLRAARSLPRDARYRVRQQTGPQPRRWGIPRCRERCTRHLAGLGRAFDFGRHGAETFEELSRLDDRLLRDIGLRRDQIPALSSSYRAGPRGDRPATGIQVRPRRPKSTSLNA